MSTDWAAASISLTAVHSYVPALCLEIAGISRYSSSDARSPVNDNIQSGRQDRLLFSIKSVTCQWLACGESEVNIGSWTVRHTEVKVMIKKVVIDTNVDIGYDVRFLKSQTYSFNYACYTVYFLWFIKTVFVIPISL